MNNFKLKAVQLDLARQMETPEFIRSFIDILADNGYNALMLYLEDRIRTASYPYPGKDESYSEDEIRELVRYGEQKGIELFPCVATLGHAERFLRRPELEELSEVQTGMLDRFGNPSVKNAFCINHPKFYPFMENYLTEVASLFPSQWFHAGLDEFWNFNLCPRCRAKMQTLDDEERAFIDHIRKIREILARSGKRMMLWSDMFEFYPHYMADVPADVVMVDWQYQEDVRYYHGHLLDQGVEDRAGANAKMGFETIFAPADRPLTNAVSYLHYAEKRKGLGFLVTSWEKSDTFLYRSYPLFCTVGRMLNGASFDEAFSGSCRSLFGTDDPVLCETMKAAAARGFLRHFGELADASLFARGFLGRDLPGEYANDSLIRLWELVRDRIATETGRRIWLDVRCALEEIRIGYRLNAIFQDAVDLGYSPVLTERAQAVYASVETLLDTLAAEWDANRPGILPNLFAKRKPELLAKLKERIGLLPVRSLVRTRYCLPDHYGVPYVRISVHTEAGWQEVVKRGSFKLPSGGALYEYANFAGIPGMPDQIRYEYHGMGGIGICFAEVRDGDGNRYFPCAVAETAGDVEHPEFLLDNDVNFAWFGSQSTRDAYYSRELFQKRSSVTLKLQKR